jgi:hypothetical protein
MPKLTALMRWNGGMATKKRGPEYYAAISAMGGRARKHTKNKPKVGATAEVGPQPATRPPQAPGPSIYEIAAEMEA